MTDPSRQYNTESVCPVCLRRIPAVYVTAPDETTTLEKTCPEHGDFSTAVWRGSPAFADWDQPLPSVQIQNPATQRGKGCPFDCGLCPDHAQRPCCVLLEITQRCNLGCPVCYAASTTQPQQDPSLETIAGWYDMLLRAGGPFNIQLSGGEPTVRDDLPEIIRIGKAKGFSFFQLNTNGIRIAAEAGYLESLAQAGLSTVYLQFDGTDDRIYQQIRGKPLLRIKQTVIDRCQQAGVSAVLVPTIVPGVNDWNIGDIVAYGLSHMPTVRCVHFQPVSYMGRYPAAPRATDRITLPELIRAICAQTGGKFTPDAFKPCGGQHALCGFQANFIRQDDGIMLPATAFGQRSAPSCCGATKTATASSSQNAQNFVARTWKPVVARGKTHEGARAPEQPATCCDDPFAEWETYLSERSRRHFTLSAMAFQDAWTLDLNRLKHCYILIVSPEGKLIPFCACNLTSQSGTPLYR